MKPRSPADLLNERIASREAKVAVIGLGYVGLPLVQAFVQAGFQTIGYDVDPAKIDQLAKGQSYIQGIPSEWVADAVGRSFHPTADSKRLAEADAILICVPTPLSDNREPDLSYVISTVEQIATVLRPGQLICLESTTYPSTTREVVLPALAKSGLTPGKDFFVAYSPERADPGNVRWSTAQIPKVVGGCDAMSGDLAVALYRQVVAEVVPVASVEIAEACKILENTYRAVNIALVNELKVLCQKMGIDVWEVIEAAKTKPFGFQAFFPGPGLGGHCIPIDPFYLSWIARKHGMSARFVELAGEINTEMPKYVVSRIGEALGARGKSIGGSKIAVLGVAYKRDVDDPRESPAFRLMALLIEGGAEVSYNDPHIPKLPRSRSHELPLMASKQLTQAYLSQQDCMVIATDHSAYDYEFIVEHSQLVVDTRNATRNVRHGREKIVQA
jgi:UDP-N-acetyl-D-glucosamine dehydrogenase